MWTNRLLSLLLIALFPILAACGGDNDSVAAEGSGEERPPRGMAWVIFDNDTIFAEIAETPEARERGLMYRTELEPNHGMLFFFEEQETQSFWMQNTYIPLDIAFLDRRQVVVDIQQMEPEVEEFTDSRRPAMFAVEVDQGWFEERGIEPGTQARIIRSY
jgi:uncharacterized protein